MSYQGDTAHLRTNKEPSTYEILGATLNGALDDSTTSVPYLGTLNTNDVIRIDSEQMLVTTGGASPATVTRGYNSTTPATHGSGVKIAIRLPDIRPMMFIIKAGRDNGGLIYIGGSSVVISDGTGLVNTGYELEASQELPYQPFQNLNQLWCIRNTDADKLSVYVLKSPQNTLPSP